MPTSPAFDLKSFQDPPAFLWPGYFWILNDRLSEERLLEQLRDMQARGARSVCLLAEPPEFRPYTFGTEMDLPYLSDAYLAMIRRMVDESARLGMHFWLYDEGGWPSGGAVGRVFAADPVQHARKTVGFTEEFIRDETPWTVPQHALCAAVHADSSWRVFFPGDVVEHLPAGTVLRVFNERVEGQSDAQSYPVPYVDILCPQAVATFVDMTHERFRRQVGAYFGTTIRFAFTDEPAYPFTSVPDRLTWTADLPDAFRARAGYDLLPVLPLLFLPPADGEDRAITRHRIDFHDLLSQLLVERYLAPIRDWCHANGLQSAGHFGGEDEPRYNADGGYGHILRALRGLDVPGVDAICRQLFPGRRSHHFTKYASSVARQAGQPYVLTESFAVYGNGLTPAEMKWVTDQQYLRGANLMVIACYPYSTRDHFMPGERPHFGPVNPLWKYMDLYHAYTARLGYLLSCGRSTCTTAVYFDIRSIWAGASTRDRAIAQHEALADALLQAQCDFDFIDDDLLAGKGSCREGGRLKVGPMQYDTIIVPQTCWMDAAALRGLAAFAEAGGIVIPVNGLPMADGGTLRWADVSDVDLPVESLTSVPARVQPVCRLSPRSTAIRARRDDVGAIRLYLLTNEENNPVRITTSFPESGTAVLCDPEDGRLYQLETAQEAGQTVIDLEFAPWGSMAILFGDGAGAALPSRRVTPSERMQLECGWTLRPCCRHRVGQHDFEVVNSTDPARPVALGDWAEWLGADFSGDAEYRMTFTCTPEQATRGARLCLGEVKHACEVRLNGVCLGQRIWKPFQFDLTGALQAGENMLCITVTNTLANALLAPDVSARWSSMSGPGWPSSGHEYDTVARQFEPDSLPSGLYGPVQIEFAHS